MENQQTELEVQEKNGKTTLARVGVLTGVFGVMAASNANAALTLDTATFVTDIGTAETFGIAIGLAILGFVAVMALVKKSRGAVK